jgi:transcriptional regulator with XRE-family HTH domain
MEASQLSTAIGKTVQSLRSERGWTQRALAERAGISSGYLSELESGVKEPSAAVLADLSLSLGIEMSEFLMLIALSACGASIPSRERRASLIPAIIALARLPRAENRDLQEYLEFLDWRAMQRQQDVAESRAGLEARRRSRAAT